MWERINLSIVWIFVSLLWFPILKFLTYFPRADTICSGFGSCVFKDSLGNSIPFCSAFDTTCTASCSCSAGYGGMDCSLNALALTSRDSLRCLHDSYLFTQNQYEQVFFASVPLLTYYLFTIYSLWIFFWCGLYFPWILPFRSSLCQAIVTAAALQDKSQALLSTLAASLLSSFSPYEVVSTSAQEMCSKALLVLATLSGEGYLTGSHSLSQSIAAVISSYTVTASAIDSSPLTSSSLYPVSSAVSTIYLTCQTNFTDYNSRLSTHKINFVYCLNFIFHDFDDKLPHAITVIMGLYLNKNLMFAIYLSFLI